MVRGHGCKFHRLLR